MSVMFEVFYQAPEDAQMEAALTADVRSRGGRLDHREVANGDSRAICLTYEFENRGQAEDAAQALRKRGVHVEGPVDYAA